MIFNSILTTTTRPAFTIYPFPPPSVWMCRVLGVSLSITTSRIYVQSVSFSTTGRRCGLGCIHAWMCRVYLSTPLAVWTCEGPLFTVCSVDIQGVFLSLVINVAMQHIFLSIISSVLWTCRVYSSTMPSAWTCTRTISSVDVQSVSFLPPCVI